MNATRFHLTLLLLLIIAGNFYSCDTIEPPYMTNGSNNNIDDEVVVRKFLLEEFTGHLCPNCPAAAETGEILANFYEERMIIISIHAGNLARPTGSTYNNDFRTSEGDALNAQFSVAGIPAGMVNRTEFEGGRVLPPGSWGPALTAFENSRPGVSIKIGNTIQNSSSSFSVPVTVKNLTNDHEGDHYLVLVLTEDGIISPQRTNDPNQPDGVILDYEHNHVLRKAITDIWGEKMDSDALISDTGFEKEFTFSTNEEWINENCHIVAYVMNSGQEILQVEKINLVP